MVRMCLRARWRIHVAQDGIADRQTLVADADIDVGGRGDEVLHHVLGFVAEGAARGVSFVGLHIPYTPAIGLIEQ